MEKGSAAMSVCIPNTEHVDFLKQLWRNGKTLSVEQTVSYGAAEKIHDQDEIACIGSGRR